MNAKDYPDFQKKALALLGLSDGKYGAINLEIDNKDRELGESLGLSPTSRVDIKDKLIQELVSQSELASKQPIARLQQLWANFR